MKSFIQKILIRLLNNTRFERNGKVQVTGWVKGIQQPEFEGKNKVLEFSNFNGRIKVGRGTTFGIHNLIHGNIEIGRYCQFAPYAAVNTFNHPTNHITTYINSNLLEGRMANFKTSKKTTIGNDVWVGKNVIILGGVRIGNGAIIAAGSIVTKDVPDFHIAGGVPAKVLKQRFSNEIIKELNELAWWDKTEEEIEKLKPLFEKELDGLKSIYE